MNKNKTHWLTLSLIFSFGWAIIYFDRMMFTPIMDTLVHEYGLTASDIGIVFSLFFLGYTLLQIPGGILGDKVGINKIINLTFIGMAFVSLLSGLFVSFAAFMVLRFLAGAFEGLYYGPQFALSSITLEKKTKVFATTIINSGMSVGIILGTTLPLFLVHQDINYKWLYGAVAFFSIVMLVLLKRFIPVVENHGKAALFKPNKQLIKVFFVSFCSLYCFFNILTWIQHYLAKEKLMDASTIALGMLLISVVSIFSALIFSRLVDKFNAIKPFTFLLLALTIVSVIALTLSTSSAFILAMIIAYGAFGKMALDPILIIAVAQANKDSSLSTTLSIFNFVGLLSSVIAPFVGGQILKYTGSLNGSFYFSAVLLAVALIVTCFFEKPSTQEA